MKCDTSVGTAKRKRTKACRVTKGSYQEFTDLVQGPRGQWLMAKRCTSRSNTFIPYRLTRDQFLISLICS